MDPKLDEVHGSLDFIYIYIYIYICVCVCVCAHACVCVHICVKDYKIWLQINYTWNPQILKFSQKNQYEKVWFSNKCQKFQLERGFDNLSESWTKVKTVLPMELALENFIIGHKYCHALNPKVFKTWEIQPQGICRFFLLDNLIQIIHTKYQY